MKITESQLRTIIRQELQNAILKEATPPAQTSGTKAAEKAGSATSLSGYETAAKQVGDEKGVTDLVVQTIKGSKAGKPEKKAIVLAALKSIIKDFDKHFAS